VSLQVVAARDGAIVVPSATTVISPPLNGIWVGGTGKVDIVTPSGTTLSFAAVPAGTLLPIQAKQVLATSDATLMVGLK
jgi:hypothetical protein